MADALLLFNVDIEVADHHDATFGADGSVLGNASAASMSKIEKRLMLSKTSEAAKSADKHMTRERRKRTNAKNHFLAVDEEG